MRTKRQDGGSRWVDPDDAPELTDAFFDQAEIAQGPKIIRRGRPKLDNPKRSVTLRIDADVLAFYRDTGPGWQSRMNDRLRDAMTSGGANIRKKP